MSEENENHDEDHDKDVEKAFAARLKSATSKQDEKIEALQEQLQQERDARIRLEVTPPKKEETQEHSRAELLQMVEEEQITQLQADKLWEEQITANVTQKVLGAVANNDSVKQVNHDLSEYRRLKPGIAKVGSDERVQVENEYQYLISIGQPNSVSTELTAVRNVFGPVEKLKKKIDLETHQEIGGGSKPPSDEKDAIKDMTARQKAYYQTRIDNNIYKDWDEVKAELKYARG